MNTDIDYKMEKSGWVLVGEPTGQCFKGVSGAWFEVTSDLAQAYFFKSKESAVNCAKSKVMCGRAWLVAPAKICSTIEATKGMRVKGGGAQ